MFPTKLIIEKEPTPLTNREPNTLYKSIADFSFPNSLATSDGFIIFNKLEKSKASEENPDFPIFDFIRNEPTFIKTHKKQKLGSVPYKAYENFFGATACNKHSISANSNKDAATTQLTAILKITMGNFLASKFLSAYAQDIWYCTKILSHIADDEKRDQSILCGPINTTDNAPCQHEIIVDEAENYIQIHNIYTGLKFNLEKNLNCPFCNALFNPSGCCCKGFEIEEYLHLDLDKELFVFDRITISKINPRFISYLGTFFSAAGARKRVPKTISIVSKFGEKHPLFNSDEELLLIPKSFCYQGSRITSNGELLGPLSSKTGQEILPDEKQARMCNAFLNVKPAIIIVENKLKSDPILFNMYAKNLIEQPLITRQDIGTFVISLPGISKSYPLALKFLQAYTDNIWNTSLVLMSNPSQKITCTRFKTKVNSAEEHTIIVDLDQMEIRILNRYNGIMILNSNSTCSICGKIALNQTSACECCKNLVINEHLLLYTKNERFNIEEINFAHFSIQFFNYISLNR